MSALANEFLAAPYSGYLKVLARTFLGSAFTARLDPSDIVAQTMLEAWANRSDFTGENEGAYRGWLRQILANTAKDMARANRAGKRDIELEVSIDQLLDRSSQRLICLATNDPSPSSQARREESLRSLSDAIELLPSLQRQIILLVHIQEMTVPAAAAEMQRSIASVVGHLRRGRKALRKFLVTEGSHEH